jgi:hypothetical protein
LALQSNESLRFGLRPNQSTRSFIWVGQNKLPNWADLEYRNQVRRSHKHGSGSEGHPEVRCDAGIRNGRSQILLFGDLKFRNANCPASFQASKREFQVEFFPGPTGISFANGLDVAIADMKGSHYKSHYSRPSTSLKQNQAENCSNARQTRPRWPVTSQTTSQKSL